MFPKPAFLAVIIALLLCTIKVQAQKPPTIKSPPKAPIDAILTESNVFSFKQSSISPDTAKAMLRVRVFEKDNSTEVIQGATVLLRRDKDKMLGRVTKHDGRCWFSAAPASYTIRVQMTGLKSFEKQGFNLEAGMVYDLEILMAKQ